MTTRGIRRKKSSLSEVKIAVIGAQGVGKSGMFMGLCPDLRPSSAPDLLSRQIDRPRYAQEQ